MLHLAEGWSGSSFVPALMVIVAAAIGLWTVRRGRRDARQRGDPARRMLEQVREEREVRNSMDTLMIGLEEFTRRLNAQLDTKSAKLECLIRDADQRINKLRSLASGGAVAEPGQQAADEDTSFTVPDTEQFQQVRSLADDGRSPIQIAQALDMPLGEVELLLNLRQSC